MFVFVAGGGAVCWLWRAGQGPNNVFVVGMVLELLSDTHTHRHTHTHTHKMVLQKREEDLEEDVGRLCHVMLSARKHDVRLHEDECYNIWETP